MKQSWKGIITFIRYICTIVGVLCIVYHSYDIYISRYDTFHSEKNSRINRSVLLAITSPNKAYRAVQFMSEDSGEGPFLPYSCLEYVSIIKSDMPDEVAWAKRYRVYTAECGDAKMMWTSLNDLSITLNSKGYMGGYRAILDGYSDFTGVNVKYEPQHSNASP